MQVSEPTIKRLGLSLSGAALLATSALQTAPTFITRGRSVALAAILLASSALVPLTSSAHFLNSPSHRWAFTNWSQSLLQLYYERDCASDWPTPDSSTSAWTLTHTPLVYHYTGATGCSGLERGTIRILNGWSTGSSYGWTENYTCFWLVGRTSSLAGGGAQEATYGRSRHHGQLLAPPIARWRPRSGRPHEPLAAISQLQRSEPAALLARAVPSGVQCRLLRTDTWQ